MKKLLNTLYVTSENSYLSLNGENIVIYEGETEKGRVPLHNLEGIVSFGYRGTSPALMGACAHRNISLCYVTRRENFSPVFPGRLKEMCFCGNSSIPAVKTRRPVWKLRKLYHGEDEAGGT